MSNALENLTMEDRCSYQMTLYYISKSLPLSSHWLYLGKYLQDRFDPEVVWDTSEPSETQTQLPFEADALRAIRDYLTEFGRHSVAGTVEIFEPVSSLVRRKSASTHQSQGDLPVSISVVSSDPLAHAFSSRRELRALLLLPTFLTFLTRRVLLLVDRSRGHRALKPRAPTARSPTMTEG